MGQNASENLFDLEIRFSVSFSQACMVFCVRLSAASARGTTQGESGSVMTAQPLFDRSWSHS